MRYLYGTALGWVVTRPMLFHSTVVTRPMRREGDVFLYAPTHRLSVGIQGRGGGRGGGRGKGEGGRGHPERTKGMPNSGSSTGSVTSFISFGNVCGLMLLWCFIICLLGENCFTSKIVHFYTLPSQQTVLYDIYFARANSFTLGM